MALVKLSTKGYPAGEMKAKRSKNNNVHRGEVEQFFLTTFAVTWRNVCRVMSGIILNKRDFEVNIRIHKMVSLLVATLFILSSGCKKKASPEEVKAASKVVERYNKAWLNQDMETMYNLSTKERIRNLTDVDPDKGSAHLELAKKRFSLIAEQTRLFLGYEQLEIEEVVKSEPGRVVFKIKALHKQGSRVEESNFLREVMKKKEGWRLN